VASRTGNISCIIDTDILIDFLRRRDYARRLLEDWTGKGLLAISVLSQLEIYQGMKTGEDKITGEFLDGLISIDMDVAIARHAGRIIRDFRPKGVTISMGDAIIAATALQVNAPLLTNNIEHYPMKDLELVRGFKI
jgi:predicted nucleic acid-binding protein